MPEPNVDLSQIDEENSHILTLGSLIIFYPQSSFTTMHYVCTYTSFTVLGLDWLDVGYRRRPFYSIHAPYRDEGRWGTMDQHAEGIL